MTVHRNRRGNAACRDADPDLFFPISTTGAALRHIEAAKRICPVCPAQVQCLAGRGKPASPMACEEAPQRTSGASSGAFPEQRQSARKMTMTRAITQQSTENMEYVRRLLNRKQPGFSAVLELARMLCRSSSVVFSPDPRGDRVL
jgi:hypothetical protein